jgi:hypothetical protein
VSTGEPIPAPKSRAELLGFRAPYLEEKLVSDGVVASAEEAAAYFDEVKKYLALCDDIQTHRLPMLSRIVDEVWHQFVLFTAEYTLFSDRFFGRYMHHAPRNAPAPDGESLLPAATSEQFVAFYQARFGPLPNLWEDWEHVTLRSRVLRETLLPLRIRFDAALDKTELVIEDTEPRVVARMDTWFEPVLSFVSETRSFYVRELPDLILAEDKVRLVASLVRRGAVRLAP